MEFAELQQEEGGGPGGARPHGMFRLAYRDEVDGSPQFARAYLPAGYTAEKQWPLVINLHGFRSSNPSYVQMDGSDARHDALADRHGAIVVYPHRPREHALSRHRRAGCAAMPGRGDGAPRG